ncbi:Asp-tRNA(Asn)/Glu-tRNA(Gln) amidotransferase subunit GatC [Candidatus Kaiserbacteria bacterium]|nr:Asp-tRNA(Asn)/Glu-tRNA(Gln) amidotransferase subunit GatC [Candidatus Kaiserbacteria bacterium]
MTGSQKVDIKALVDLARLEIGEEDMKKLAEQIPAILSFVTRIQEVATSGETDTNPAHKNVMRDDTDAYKPGVFTEALLKAAPRREGDYVRVPQVIKK